MINLSQIWFTHEEHKLNYFRLMQTWPVIARSGEFAAAAYFSACPEVYYRIDWTKKHKSPISWYYGKWVGTENDGYSEESEIVGRLSGTFENLARLAVELYTSRRGEKYPFDLINLIGNADEIRMSMFTMMVDLRRGVRTYRHMMLETVE